MKDQPVTVQTVAEWVGGTVEGDGNVTVRGLAPLDAATSDDLSFADDAHLGNLATTRAAAAMVSAQADVDRAEIPLIRVEHLEQAVATALAQWAPPEDNPPGGVHPSAAIDPAAKLGPGAAVGQNVVVGPDAVIGERVVLCANVVIGRNVTIGDETVISEGAVIKARCRIGRRVRIGPNCVIGFDGFGYYQFDGAHHHVPHVGNVVIEDDVDLGACVCVDRGKFGATRIGRGTKIDNLVQIAHNVQIGPHCILVGQCGIAGSTKIGSYVVIGGSAGVRDNINIGDGAILAAYCAVAGDVPDGEAVGGIPARSLKEMRRVWMAQVKLPELLKRVKKLESALKKLDESPTDH